MFCQAQELAETSTDNFFFDMGGPCPIFHLSQSPAETPGQTPSHHHFTYPQIICAFSVLIGLGPQLVPKQSLWSVNSTWTHPKIGWRLWDFSPLLSCFHKVLLSVLWHVWFLPASVFSRGRMDRQWIPGYFYVGGWYKYEYASISCFCEVVLHTCFQTDVVFLCVVWIS